MPCKLSNSCSLQYEQTAWLPVSCSYQLLGEKVKKYLSRLVTKKVSLTPQLCQTRYDSCDSFTPQAFFFCGHLRHATLASECTFPFFGLSCLTLPLQVVLPKLCSGFFMWRDPLEAGASTRTSCNIKNLRMLQLFTGF